ncbi:ABC transporter permease [Pedobacter sp. MR2016-19]|uniref:ABC transporter permease n=1 Tax=Pedobacter sp. MR2016-19 TaxID=2780089 RepID=UPI00187638C9|nr:ABC transporter permease [Pedobacter sp. MR2016-19]MBE5318717.1 ABC transporter permease [Pedobacter sp. MR2016-19]
MLYEIFHSIYSNKTRSLLTGLGIIWGIFILIILVGVGKGFQDGVLEQFDGFSKKTLYVFSTHTTGSEIDETANREIYFNEKDVANLHRLLPPISNISPQIQQNLTLVSGKLRASFDVKAVYPTFFSINMLQVSEGRLLNQNDFSFKRKVVLLGKDVAEVLFGKSKTCIGKSVRISNEYFTVVGVIKTNLLTALESRSVYLPFSSFNTFINSSAKIKLLIISLFPGTSTTAVESKIRLYMADHYNFHAGDKNAFIFNSVEEQVKAFNSFFSSLKGFLWFIGISSLLSGIIGVGNIMYTVAKERTKEIGIRKAVGARNIQIMWLFISESIIITSVSGLLGLGMGTLVLKMIKLAMNEGDGQGTNQIFKNPSIDYPIIISALIILIISGTLAGIIPATFAARLKPVDALKQE